MNQSIEFNLASSAFKANPYPVFAQLRACNPVHQLSSSHGQSTWLITRYADVEYVLRDERFVKDKQHVLSSGECAHLYTSPPSPTDLMSMSMVDFDPPRSHTFTYAGQPFFHTSPDGAVAWTHSGDHQ